MHGIVAASLGSWYCYDKDLVVDAGMLDHREIARAKGLKRYEDGVKCCNGHVAEKYVCSGACIECLRAAGKKLREENRQKAAQKQKEFRTKHAERLKAERAFRSSAKQKIEKTSKPAIVLPDISCVTCGAHIPRRINKDGSHSKLTPKYCSSSCKPARVVELWCLYCGQHTIRHTSGGDDKKYCTRSCYERKRAHIKLEVLSLCRIAEAWYVAAPVVREPDIVSIEVAGIRRLGRLTKKCKTVRPCRGGCGNRLPGIAEYSRTCADCSNRLRLESEAYRATRRRHRAARRAIERGLDAERIDPIEVLEADGWRCYICGIDTPRELRGTYEPNAPEVEHVIPLAAGGKHVRSNLRCACRSCNGIKGAKY